MAQQVEEAAGKDKPNGAERAADKTPDRADDDKSERPARPRLRQTSRKVVSMER